MHENVAVFFFVLLLQELVPNAVAQYAKKKQNFERLLHFWFFARRAHDEPTQQTKITKFNNENIQLTLIVDVWFSHLARAFIDFCMFFFVLLFVSTFFCVFCVVLLQFG